MTRKAKSKEKMDLSSFMSILLMTIGCLVTVLVSNTLIIISNPENVQISSVISASPYIGEGGEEDSDNEGHAKRGPPAFSNTQKQPSYIDVYRDRLIIYGLTDEREFLRPEVMPVTDMEFEDNALRRFLDTQADRRDTDYIVLLARPGSADVLRRLKRLIIDRGIDVGHELFEFGRKLQYN